MAKNKINILQVVAGMNRGGAETFLMNVLRTIDRDNYNFIFLCYGEEPFAYEKEIIKLGAKIVRIPEVTKRGLYGHFKDIQNVIRAEKIDVIHAHTYFNSMFSLFAGKIMNIKVRIVHSHNTKSEENPSLLKKLYFLISKKIIRISATTYVACGNLAGKSLFGSNDFTTINNGIITKDFKYNLKERQVLRLDIGVNENDKVLMHIGRFEEQKNHDFLIDIFAEYHKKNPLSKLLLVGDGPLRDDIEEKVHMLDLKDYVIFLGIRTDVSSLYNVADVFVFPSLFEGLPVVLIEAQANGLPCVVSDVVDQDVKISDELSFFSLSHKSTDWANLVQTTGNDRREQLDRLSGGPYDINTVVDQLLNIYKEELKEK